MHDERHIRRGDCWLLPVRLARKGDKALVAEGGWAEIHKIHTEDPGAAFIEMDFWVHAGPWRGGIWTDRLAADSHLVDPGPVDPPRGWGPPTGGRGGNRYRR